MLGRRDHRRQQVDVPALESQVELGSAGLREAGSRPRTCRCSTAPLLGECSCAFAQPFEERKRCASGARSSSRRTLPRGTRSSRCEHRPASSSRTPMSPSPAGRGSSRRRRARRSESRRAHRSCGDCCLHCLAAQFASCERALRSTPKIVDRTLACTVAFSNGARTIGANVRSAYRSGEHDGVARTGDRSRRSVIRCRRRTSSRRSSGLTAGWPPPPPLESGGLGLREHTLCRAARPRVPLSNAGLRLEAPASVFGDEVRCRTPKTILVRVRATFSAPATLEPSKDGTFVGASGRIVRGQVAVRTLAGAAARLRGRHRRGEGTPLHVSKVCT